MVAMQETLSFIKNKIGDFKPEIAIVLGSGLGGFVDNANGLETVAVIDYRDIPHFKTSSVVGHSSKLIFARVGGKNVVVMQGRLHFYEGHSLAETTYPVKVLKSLGVTTLVLSNAAGGINPNYSRGDLVLITDHINFLGTNPLIGKNDDTLGPRFPDMSAVYSKPLCDLAKVCANELNIGLKEGVYLATTGPSYETPAEIKMFRGFGADLVGMSTAPEAIVANYCGIKVLAISLVTNLASGMSQAQLNHEEVVEIGKKAGEKFTRLVREIVEKI